MGKVRKFSAGNIRRITGGKDPVRIVDEFILRRGLDPEEVSQERNNDNYRWMLSLDEDEDLEVLLVTGSNTSETHPVISTFLREAVVKNGAKLIVIDPRRIEMTQFADIYLQLKPGTDVILFQALAHVIVEEGLIDQDFLDSRVEGLEEISSR